MEENGVEEESGADPSVFFLDRNIGRVRVAKLLRDAGLTVQVHDDYFGQTTSDEDWIRRCGADGWLAVSADKDIRHSPWLVECIVESRAKVFLLSNTKHATAQDNAETIRRATRRIEAAATSAGDGYLLASIHRDGGVRVWRSPSLDQAPPDSA